MDIAWCTWLWCLSIWSSTWLRLHSAAESHIGRLVTFTRGEGIICDPVDDVKLKVVDDDFVALIRNFDLQTTRKPRVEWRCHHECHAWVRKAGCVKRERILAAKEEHSSIESLLVRWFKTQFCLWYWPVFFLSRSPGRALLISFQRILKVFFKSVRLGTITNVLFILSFFRKDCLTKAFITILLLFYNWPSGVSTYKKSILIWLIMAYILHNNIVI